MAQKQANTPERDARDKAFLDYLKKVEETLKAWLELLEEKENRIRRPNSSE